MRYRLLSATLAFLFACPPVFAQIKERLKIEHATVFLKGAELYSTAAVSLPAGESEVLFTNAAGNINQQSLTAGADNRVIVQSVTFQNNYLTSTETPKTKALKDSIDKVTDNEGLIKNKLATIDEQISIIKANQKVSGGNTGLSVAELTKMLDLVNARLNKLLDEQQNFNIQIKKTDDLLTRLQQQLSEEQQKNTQPGGTLLVKFYTTQAVRANVMITYVTPNAYWIPFYDLRADGISDSISLYYKANIVQNCGVAWNDIHLTLSSGNPNEGAIAPELAPWYLSFYMPQPEINVRTYKIPLIAKDEAAPSIQGGRSDNNSYSINGVAPYVTVDNSGISTTYDIDLPYTILSDGQPHAVAIKNYTLPAIYRYYAVPKKDKDAFLTARVTHWEDLNLLPGNTNIFYEGNYVGQGMAETGNTTDTMSFSLGRDKSIIVKRTLDSKLRSVKTIGTNVRESFAYNITVRNTRKKNIRIDLLDQVPVSNDKDISVEDIQADGADIDDKTGIATWHMALQPNETKQVTIGYTVKYPKGKTINNLR